MEGYGIPADNSKGILSLLSAIEQSSSQDNFDPDTSPSKMIDKDFPNLQNHLNLETIEIASEIQLAHFSCCLICGRSPDIEGNESMVDIEHFERGEKGTTLFSVLDEILSLGRESSRGPLLTCLDCFSILDAIAKLKVKMDEYVSIIEAKYNEYTAKKSRFPTVSDYASMLELKMPLNIFNVRDEEPQSLPPPAPKEPPSKKSKLQILAETLEGDQSAATSVAPAVLAPNSPILSPPQAPLSPPPGDVADASSAEGDLDILDDARLSLDKENLVDGGKCTNCELCGQTYKPFGQRKKKSSKTCPDCSLNGKKKVQKRISRVWTCKYCMEKFIHKPSHDQHVKTQHTAEVDKSMFASYLPLQCPECGLVFETQKERIAHSKITLHKLSKRAIACSECDMTFQSFQALQYHMSKHTGKFSFTCEFCSKGFNNYKLLEEHSHIHTGEKPYQCSQCNEHFANRGSLWLHVKKHGTERPYVCDHCDKAFTHSSHLAVHRRLHTGETPYKCRLCSSGFIACSHLMRHMKNVHDNAPAYACSICDLPFAKRSELVKHANAVHNGNIVDAVTKTRQGGINVGAAPVVAEVVAMSILPTSNVVAAVATSKRKVVVEKVNQLQVSASIPTSDHQPISNLQPTSNPQPSFDPPQPSSGPRPTSEPQPTSSPSKSKAKSKRSTGGGEMKPPAPPRNRKKPAKKNYNVSGIAPPPPPQSNQPTEYIIVNSDGSSASVGGQELLLPVDMFGGEETAAAALMTAASAGKEKIVYLDVAQAQTMLDNSSILS